MTRYVDPRDPNYDEEQEIDYFDLEDYAYEMVQDEKIWEEIDRAKACSD